MPKESPNHIDTPKSGLKKEFRRLVQLALPLMGTQLAQMGMGVMDTIMAGHISPQDLAGVALAGAVLWPTMLLMMGTLQAVTPGVAQLSGAGRMTEVGELIRQALWIALVAALVVCAVITHCEPYYQLVGVDPAAMAISIPYLQATAWGVPALMGYFTLRFLAEGMGYTKPAMIIAISALVLKLPLNYIFMYGEFGMPAMGGVGCGVSSAIVMWYSLFAIILFVLGRRFAKTGWMKKFSRPDGKVIRELLYVGLPIGVTLFLEIGVFTLITALLGRLGSEMVASHTIAMSLAGVTFMFPLAIGIASTIRIGFNVGAENFPAARQTALAAMLCSLVTGTLAAIAVLFLREGIAQLYTNDQVVFALAVKLMVFVAFFQVFDHCQAVAVGALRGYKDTRLPLWIVIGCYWCIGLPLACTLGFGWLYEPMGIYGFWTGLIVGLGLVSICVLPRLWWLSKSDKKIRELANI